MGISYLIAGFVFFFLPNFSIVDLLPDFIGCILIIKGLGKLADLTPGLADAKKSFLNVMYIYIAKFFLMFTVPFFGNTDGGFILVFSFTFAVLDLIFTLPAFKALLNGFLYLGDRTNASVIFKNQSELSTLTSIFIFVRAGLALLPDFSYISTPDYSGTVESSGGFYLSDYRTLLVTVNFLITGLVGFIWLIYAVNYFKSISKDKTFMSFLEEKYKTTVLPNKGLFTRRTVKNAFVFLSIGGIFMFDFLIDLVNVLPDFLGLLCFLICALLLKKYCNSKPLTAASVVCLILSLISWSALCYYAIKYPAVNIWSDFEAYDLFVTVNITNMLKYISLIILFIVLHKTVNELIDRHTGSSIDELESVSRANLQKQKALKKSNKITLILGVICCFSGIARTILLYDFAEFVIFDTLINLIWIYHLYKTINSTNEAVEYRYL